MKKDSCTCAYCSSRKLTEENSVDLLPPMYILTTEEDEFIFYSLEDAQEFIDDCGFDPSTDTVYKASNVTELRFGLFE